VKHNLSDVIDLAYRVDLPRDEWLSRLAESVHCRRGLGEGALAYELDLSPFDQPARLGSVAATSGIEVFARNTEPLHRTLASSAYHRVFRIGTHCATVRVRMAEEGMRLDEYPRLAWMIEASGARDIWAVATANPTGRTLTIAIPIKHDYVPTRAERQVWRKVGIHIAAGHRLRDSIAGESPARDADAILRPDGRTVHLTRRAVSHQEALTRAVRAIDTARARDYRYGSNETLELWTGLVEGTWSLIDWEDTDGSRLFLAVENDPETTASRRLTQKEAQVATYVAQRHPYKLVAYELGISISTVSTHLRKALKKLGLSSRMELVWLHGHLVATRES
jgi:DNA-binding CsgD family transcriptional regulator